MVDAPLGPPQRHALGGPGSLPRPALGPARRGSGRPPPSPPPWGAPAPYLGPPWGRRGAAPALGPPGARCGSVAQPALGAARRGAGRPSLRPAARRGSGARPAWSAVRLRTPARSGARPRPDQAVLYKQAMPRQRKQALLAFATGALAMLAIFAPAGAGAAPRASVLVVGGSPPELTPPPPSH